MVHEFLPVGLLACNCSIVGDERSREAVVIDPGGDAGNILEAVSRRGLRVMAILLTHGHMDHVGALREVQSHTGAPAFMHEDEGPVYDGIEAQASWLGMPAPVRADVSATLKDGDIVRAGELELAVLHTPGHTPGSVSFYLASMGRLIAGDTLFRESVGRTDLPGGDGGRLLQSIREKYLPLPDDTLIVPGHGPTTTLRHEKRYNFFLQRL